MLPSTGLFKATNCSFYDSGLCERPYCHFRHVRKDSSCSLEADEEVLEQLVSDAVQKVLQNSELPSSSSSEQLPNEDFVSKVVEDLLPDPEEKDCTHVKPSHLPAAVPSYKPTPIAELNKKRHIPVPYTPRNCSSVQPKRQISSEHFFTPKVKKDQPSAECPVTPSSEYNPDVDTNKCVGYSPSLPKNQTNGTNNHSYIPSAIANLISPLIDYVPMGNSDKNFSYEPSGKKIQEPEYRPHFDSGSTMNPSNYTPTDKAVLEELNLDEFSTELELLDEIIYEHSESVNKKNLEKPSDESSTDYLEGSEKPIDTKDKTFDNISQALSAVNENITSVTCSPVLGDVKVPNDSADKDVTVTKEEQVAKEKEHHRHSKSSRHSSSKSKSSRSSKSSSSSSKDKKHEDKHRHKTSKSSGKTDNSKEHKSSSSSKSSKKSSSSSTSKDHKSGSHSKETKSSSSSKKHSKHTKRKRSPDKNEVRSFQPSDDAAGDSDADANSCSNEPLTDPDDDEIEEECFKIFQEYAPAAESSKKNLLPFQPTTTEEPGPEPPSKKLRVAHDVTTQSLSKLVAPPRRKPVINPALTMIKRFEDLKDSYELKVSEKVARTTLLMRRVEVGGLLTNSKPSAAPTPPTKNLNRGLLTANSSLVKTLSAPPSTAPTSTKLRIAHVPNVPNLLEEKTRVQTSKQVLHQRTLLKNRIGSSGLQQTVAQSAPKGGHRSAHVPAPSQLQKPVILPETGSKIPTSTRQKYLDVLIKEHESFMSKEESYKKAAEAEKFAFQKSNNKTIYASSVTGAIMRLRKEQGKSGANNTSGVVHHSAMLGGRKGSEWSVIQPKKPVVISVYHHLVQYILTEQQLVDNGFPRHHPTIKGMAVSKSAYDKNLPWEGHARICSRCSRNYSVDSKGLQVENDDCPHHWGKLSKSVYRCCSGGIDSPACSVAPCHVTSNFKMNNTGFVETITADNEPPDGDFGVYALDCEMIYTTKGLELARVTVVDRTMAVVYDTMVKPRNPILDYSTRFSGITEEHMKDVTTTIRHVQAAMMSFINSKTILIGHSLDSDLRALKLIHDTVVDTSVVFPHPRNSEFKNPLRGLTYKYLHRLIQENVEGHNSAEDAIASMELMLYRVKEDLKTS